MEKSQDKIKKKRPTAEKRLLQAEKKRLRNRSTKSRIGTAVREFLSSIKTGNADVQIRLDKAFSLLDKGAKHRIVNKNRVNRIKSRLSKKICSTVKS